MQTEALKIIAALHDGVPFGSLTKADLFEALKVARHVAKAALAATERN